MKITILEPRGYCAGVNQAIEMALTARKNHPLLMVNVLGMLVHNSYVIAFLKQHDIGLIKNIHEAPNGSAIIFTAHGHENKDEQIAKEKNLVIYDAICPLVKKNLATIAKEKENHHQVIYIGYPSHPETLAAISSNTNVYLYSIGQTFDYDVISDASPLIINQTTLNILSLENIHQDIKNHLPKARLQDEICRATRNRQEALLQIEEDVDAIIVVGSEKSSNAKRLYEIAQSVHPQVDAFLIESATELPKEILKTKRHIVISSSASAPLSLIEEISNELVNLKQL